MTPTKKLTLKQTASRHHKETQQRKHHFNTLVSEALKLCQYSQHNANLINQFQSQYPQQKQQLIMTQQHLYTLQYQLTEAYHTIDYLNTQNQYYGHAHASGLYQPIYPTCPPLLTYAQGSKHQHRIPLSSQSPVLHPQKYRHTVFQPTLFINQSRTHTFQPSSIEIAYHCRQIISILSQPTASFHLFSKGNMQHYSHQNGYADIDIVACPVNDTHQQYGLPIIAKASLIQQLISAERYHAIIAPTRADLINAKLSTVSEQGHPIEFDLSIYFLRHNEPACYFWHRIVCEHSVSSHSQGLTPLHDYQTHFILGNTFIPLNTVGLYCLTERDLPFWLKEIHRALQHHHVIAPSLIEKVTSLINNVNPNESAFSFFKTPYASHLHLFPEPIFQALTLKFGPFPEPDQQHDELKSPHPTLEQNRNSPITRRSTLTFFTPNSKTTEDLMHTQRCYL